MKPTHVFFFRGLSTYGGDQAKWSVFDFGPMYKHFASELGSRGIAFHPVLGMGSGPLLEVVSRARTFIESHPAWQDPSLPVHLFGHSAGGLVARLVFQQLSLEGRAEGKIASVLTLATPNQGSRLAQICVDMPRDHRGSAMFLKAFGYDLASKRHFFEELLAARVSATLGSFDHVGSTELNSILSHAPRGSWCWPLRTFYKIKAFNQFDLPSDGLVERDSQAFGKVIAELDLDHFRQIGIFRDGQRFAQMCDMIARQLRRAEG